MGKTTVAINLAFTLSKILNKKVGILDADLYGPSIPFLISKRNSTTYYSDPVNKRIAPVEFEGIKTMSMGYTNNNSKAIIRGPIASQIIREFYENTDWGDLDYLIIDFPPGTHDIHLTLAQELAIDGALIVTTPQNLSYIDVMKGIDTLDTMGIPSLGLVENMSFFNCGGCDTKHRIFGESKVESFKKQFGIQKSFALGVYDEISKINDQGLPFALVLPEQHEINLQFKDIAEGLIEELDLLLKERTVFEYQQDLEEESVTFREVVETTKEIQKSATLSFKKLRNSCRCALCEDEITGQRLTPKNQNCIKKGLLINRPRGSEAFDSGKKRKLCSGSDLVRWTSVFNLPFSSVI